jgi:hypothetical protein
MLARLRHHRLVRRDHEEDGVDPAGAGEHVADESLVTGHVDERNPHVLPLRVREAEIDRDAPPLLLRQPVGVDPRQRAHERGLPVVDMPRRADEKAVHYRKATAIV